MSPPNLRHLVACTACKRQYDASEVAPGSRFHCDCGEVVVVEPPRPHEASVVRCSACGAPRASDEQACGFCGSAFTLHEKDMHTICPSCATRISNRARFCHSCAAPIAPQTIAGDETSLRCPACRHAPALRSRPLDEHRVSILECHACAGIWIGPDVFQLLEEKALDREVGWNTLRKSENTEGEFELNRPGAALYRRCPTCGELMNRTNYSRRSGVIIDICPGHGIWFDHGELARIVRWIRDGNWTRSKRQQILEDAEMTAARKTAAAMPRATTTMSPYSTGPTVLGRLISFVIDMMTG